MINKLSERQNFVLNRFLSKVKSDDELRRKLAAANYLISTIEHMWGCDVLEFAVAYQNSLSAQIGSIYEVDDKVEGFDVIELEQVAAMINDDGSGVFFAEINEIVASEVFDCVPSMTSTSLDRRIIGLLGELA